MTWLLYDYGLEAMSLTQSSSFICGRCLTNYLACKCVWLHVFLPGQQQNCLSGKIKVACTKCCCALIYFLCTNCILTFSSILPPCYHWVLDMIIRIYFRNSCLLSSYNSNFELSFNVLIQKQRSKNWVNCLSRAFSVCCLRVPSVTLASSYVSKHWEP